MTQGRDDGVADERDGKVTDGRRERAAGGRGGRAGRGVRGEQAGRDVDVLVVGAGPTGLLAACELLRRGVRVRVVDRAPQPVRAPKALSLWPRALDILQDVGVLDGIRDASQRIDAFSYFSDGHPVASFGFAEDLASRTLPQHETERLLTERLHALGGKVERGVRLLGFDESDPAGPIEATDQVTSILEHADGGVERAHTPFVIGADGARSAVRGQLGTGFEGSTYEMAFALTDTHVDGALPADEIRYYQSPTGTLVIVPMPRGVFRLLAVMPGGRSGIDVPTMQGIVDERGPRGVRITRPVWQTVFRVHARRATEFQRGRVFLMGDAAHVHSPAGGQGMNNGLQDAHNLGWKLAAVVHGRSPASLLLSYGPERVEATRRIVRDTDLQTRAWMVEHPAAVRVRDTAFRLLERSGAVSRFYAPVMAGRRLAYTPVRETQRPSARPACSVRGRLPGGVRVGAVFPRAVAVALGIAGPGADPARWTVAAVSSPGQGGWLAAVDRSVSRRPGVRTVRVTPAALAPHGACERPGYYLIRPDGHIAAHGHQGDLHRLRAELAAVLLDRPSERGPESGLSGPFLDV
ncbi:FAD-dependent monooxygenase [Streptomyces sp. NPDC056160]|uniref:FAD-dependent monooxygenase n=1 Tax=Streptomyces sp. NPDC056160 TaxID=3345731 RepID=UPI0035DD6FED